MKRIFHFFLTIILLMSFGVELQAKGVTAGQLFYLIRQAFPDAKELSLFISKSDYQTLEEDVKRATLQFKLKARVYLVATSRDVGSALKNVKSGSVVIVFNSETLESSDTRLYVLSKCKEKKAAIVTSSKDYASSGALIGIYRDDADQLMLTLNLKKNESYKGKFTDEVIQKIGFKDVVL